MHSLANSHCKHNLSAWFEQLDDKPEQVQPNSFVCSIAAGTDHLHRDLRQLMGNRKPEKKKIIGDFITLDGPFVLMDLIAALVPHKKSGRVGCGGQSGPKYGVGVTHLLNELCSILRELLYDFPGLAHVSTVGSIDFVNLIVDHLLGINNADTAMVLLEEIVAYRTETFRLANIPNFQQIVMTLSSRQLALFMRLFAILIF
jgi:hypothetical protein